MAGLRVLKRAAAHRARLRPTLSLFVRRTAPGGFLRRREKRFRYHGTIGDQRAAISLGVVGHRFGRARSKRALVALGASMVAVTALIIGIWPNFPLVFTALVLHGTTGAFLGPAIAILHSRPPMRPIKSELSRRSRDSGTTVSWFSHRTPTSSRVRWRQWLEK